MLNRRRFATCAICSAIGLVATKVDANAQAAGGVTRTILQKTEFPGEKYATVLAVAEIAPGALVARHTHPGVESAYVTEGGGRLSVKGQPDREIKAGDGFQIPAEVPHSLKNGNGRTLVTVTYVVEKDKPLASPAPE
ncbi:MAG: cupin domain-containing protein [Acetobacteraceae bacterium]|nr:cupin domain-containing protein [Acetobacteraceae bacterium]